MAVADEIEARLVAEWPGAEVSVRNDSTSHAGHMGDDGSGESHFHVTIAAPALGDMSRVARHRAVHAALGPDLIGRIHALALDIR
ncbi:BolA family protein [Aestuariibius insulae]|uniref:BolA family protein n=1 Tax=Aestuariibius insulae TaxID=2058287 RepID=UPI00345E1769